MVTDTTLGFLLGFVAGIVFRSVFETAWNWGCGLFGPVRPSEDAVAPGHVAGFTAVRLTFGCVFGCVAVEL